MSNFAAPYKVPLTHGVIGNTTDFGSAESWFEPRWVNKKSRNRGFFCLAPALTLAPGLSSALQPKPTVIKFNSNPYHGKPLGRCDALTMYTIDPSHSPNEWFDFIKNCSVKGSSGEEYVAYNELYSEFGFDYLNTLDANTWVEDMQNIVNQGYNYLSLYVENYYNNEGIGPATHEMAVNGVKYYPNKVNLVVSDWGQDTNNKEVYNYTMVYTLGRTKFTPVNFTFYRKK